MKDTFSTYHPLIILAFFTLAIGVSIFSLHPAVLFISFAGSFAYSVKLNKRRALKFNLLFLMPAMAAAAVFNPIFVHEGATVLWYFPSGNPLTLESCVYGAASSVMLGSVIMWFGCFNHVMTSDKLIYLFGRLMPALSLTLSMVLRFVPRYKAQAKVVSNGQRCLGRDIAMGGIFERASGGLKILSIMLTWSLENGVETADSMKSRGFGLKGRTCFSNYHFDRRDAEAALAMALLSAAFMLGAFLGFLKIRFYPTVKFATVSGAAMAVHASFMALCFMPLIIDATEEIKWSYLKS